MRKRIGGAGSQGRSFPRWLRACWLRVEAAIQSVTGTKLASMAAGKMGYSTTEVGDLVVEALSGAWIYAIPMALAIGGNFISRRRRETRSRLVWEQARTDGLVEPASLHPVIDPMFCVGCASCVEACPENEVLGLIGGKAQVINPTRCIGHGACEPACPNENLSVSPTHSH